MTFAEQVERLPHALVPRVLTVHGKYPGPNLYRCWWPNGYLSLRGFIADSCSYDRFDEQRPLIAGGRYNMIVTPRIAFSSERAFTQWHDVIRQTGIAWVYDADDDLWSPDFPQRQIEVFRDLPEATTTLAEYEIERQQRIYVLERVDGVTVTTPHLANIAGGFTSRPVHIMPNLINLAAFEFAMRVRRDIPPLTVGWSGTRRQEDDLELVAEAWQRVAEKHPDVRFVVQGYQSPALCNAVPTDRLVVLGGVSTEQYPGVLRNIDIACCSVSNDPWNLSKSPIKYLEASLAGSACVVSQSLYGQYVEDGATGLIAKDAEGWYQAICRLIENEELRRQIQQAARKMVLREHTLDAHWPSWILAWTAILDAKRRVEGSHDATDTSSKPREATASATR